ncbi:uncharacterized protein MONBRDRAFT_30131 [Monosiga brevicollis MX1]|uniref:SH2 domain-containing protein n=1 Tax=Monosiga brevicollis TaxID=81824 RepID=A9VD43_MONBE|nr:uncharacterized protein MONBRDRAFT_30131 [Monosiga brevicollis MX1]EDQ84576.1 predicted protein [Monosiga brevicollis MX1]|eukprot:XP_001750603.1 hypothetical protein [Monosiga brevicollis MX1]
MGWLCAGPAVIRESPGRRQPGRFDSVYVYVYVCVCVVCVCVSLSPFWNFSLSLSLSLSLSSLFSLSLVFFFSMSSDVVRNGWLIKSPPPGALKGWKRRFFRFLRATNAGKARMEYYVDPGDVQRSMPKGIINLSDCTTVEEGPSEERRMKFFFRIVLPQRTYVLCAENRLERDDWIKDLREELFAKAVATPPAATPAPTPALPSNPASPAHSSRNSASSGSQLPGHSVRQPPPTPTPFQGQPASSPSKDHGASRPQPKPVGPDNWLYGKISRQMAEDLLADYGHQQGMFIVRESSQRGSHAVTVVHQGRVIHHLVTQTAGGLYLLNNQPCGSCASLEEVIDFLGTPHSTPVRWKSALIISPLDFDKNLLSGGANKRQSTALPAYTSLPLQSETEAPPSPSAATSVPASPAACLAASLPRPTNRPSHSEQVYSCQLCATDGARRLGITANMRCDVRVIGRDFAVLNPANSVELASWNVIGVQSVCATPKQFEFVIVGSQPNPGHFCLETTESQAILAALKPFLPPSAIRPSNSANVVEPGFELMSSALNDDDSDDERAVQDYQWDNHGVEEPPAPALPSRTVSAEPNNAAVPPLPRRDAKRQYPGLPTRRRQEVGLQPRG